MSKSKAAAALGRKRWAGVDKDERSAQMAELRAKRNMSPEARSAIGQRLSQARAKKRASNTDTEQTN